MEITSISAKVTLHFKGPAKGKPEAVTIYNGTPQMYSLVPHDQVAHDDFFEVNTAKV